jgi:hypothetical protein
MSLHKLATEIQKKGRGDDRMLVHMTPKEVEGLQAIARAHGGSLTINPDTGLVEAGFLKNIMPMIVGAGLAAATGGTSLALTPGMIGLGYGGFEALRTGDIIKGVMAGLGAYGGAGLAGMAGVGAAGGAGAGSGAGAVTPEWTASNTGLNVIPGEAGTIASAAPTATPGWAQTSTGLNVLPGEAGTAASRSIAPTMGNAIKYGGASIAPMAASALEPPPPPEAEEYKRRYPELTLSEGFRGYTPPKPDPYYGARGLGYAEGGEVDGYFSGGVLRNLFSKLKDDREMRISKDFQPLEARQPDNYYVPQGLGYAMGGTVDPMQKMPNGGLAALQGMRDGYAPMTTMDGNIPQFAAGGDVKKKRATRTSAAQLAAMDPMEAGIAQLNNARAMAQMGGGNFALPKRSVEELGVISAAKGRYLKGDGDGMSDSIPATINGRQPARLADGEFVVPADVVSHIGNGSSDAGAKKLYAMMDKVRVARTGKKKQAPAVKTDRYLPA